MQVNLLRVKDVMHKHVETILSGFTVDEAIKKMAEKNVGSLVVMSGQGPIGILSERDLVSKLMALGKKPGNTMVTDVMSGEIVKFHPDQSLKEAAATMNSKKNRLLVFDGDRIVGIVTATDIVRGISEMESSFDIDKAVVKSVYTLNAETHVKQAVDVMSQLRVGSVIIMRNGRPVGIFTEWDLVRNVLFPPLDLEQPLENLATGPLITAEEGIGGRQAAEIMTTNRIKRLPLTRNGVITGIITARDLVEAYANS